MELKNKILSLLKKADLFPSTQFLRYQKETQYKTALGGSVSLIIITLLIALFVNTGLQTINKTLISSAISSSIQGDPPQTNFTASVDGGYMFGFYMLGVNFSDPSRKIFDVTLNYVTYGPLLTKINSTPISLEKCTRQHFTFNKQTIQSYQRSVPDWILCPAIGAEFNVQGSGISKIYTRLQIKVTRCDPSRDVNCISDSQANSHQQALGGYFLYGFLSVNSIVNPNDQMYKDYYLDDSNYYYIFLNSTSFSQITTQLQQNTINTDISLLPFQDNVQEKSLTNSERVILRTKPRTNNLYSHIIMEKSKKHITYSRSFNKIDNLFSYIGGFVGVVLLIFFILSSYSEALFTFSIAQNLFDHPSNRQPKKSFNFLYYLSIKFKQLLQIFKYSNPWKDTDNFKEHMDEAQDQLDICLILKRLFYLQEVLSVMLPQPYLDAIYLCKKVTRKEARERRLKNNFLFRFRQQIGKQSEQLQLQGNNKSQMILNLQNEQNLSYKSGKDDFSINIQSLQSKMKTKIIEVMQKGRKGDEISKIILPKLDKNIFRSFGISSHNQINQIHSIQQKQIKDNFIFLDQQPYIGQIKKQG